MRTLGDAMRSTADGFVTVVPVERRARDKQGGEWSRRDQSPCTARMMSKASRRDPSPYGMHRAPKDVMGRTAGRSASISRAPEEKTRATRGANRDPSPGGRIRTSGARDPSPAGGKIMRGSSDASLRVKPKCATLPRNTGTSKRDPSPAASKSTSKRDPSPTMGRSTSRRDPSPSTCPKTQIKKNPSVKRDPSPSRNKRDQSPRGYPRPSINRTKSFGTDSPRGSNPPSRSSSFGRGDQITVSRQPSIRSGRTTIPREKGQRSRSSGESSYVTVLEIGSSAEGRSRSTGSLGKTGDGKAGGSRKQQTTPATATEPTDTASARRRPAGAPTITRPVSRTGSLKKVGGSSSSSTGAGPVSVHVKLSADLQRCETSAKPTRKQSIKIERSDYATEPKTVYSIAEISSGARGEEGCGQKQLAECRAGGPAIALALAASQAESAAVIGTRKDAAVQCLTSNQTNSANNEEGRHDHATTSHDVVSSVEEDIQVHRAPGEKLGFGLRFEGGAKASESVKRLYIQCCSPASPATRTACTWGGLAEGDEILYIGGLEVCKLTRLECVKALKDSPVTVNMRIRHYFHQLTTPQSSSYDLHLDRSPARDKRSNTLPKQFKEKTSQTSPKKPVRSLSKRSTMPSLGLHPDPATQGTKLKLTKKALLSSQSLRSSSSVPSLGLAKGFAETETIKLNGKNSPLSSSGKKTVRGSPKASNVRELIERKVSLNPITLEPARAATLPKKTNLFTKKENLRKSNTMPRNPETEALSLSRESSRDSFVSDDSGSLSRKESKSLENLVDFPTVLDDWDYLECSQTLPRSYKTDSQLLGDGNFILKSGSYACLESTDIDADMAFDEQFCNTLSKASIPDNMPKWFSSTLPKSYSHLKSSLDTHRHQEDSQPYGGQEAWNIRSTGLEDEVRWRSGSIEEEARRKSVGFDEDVRRRSGSQDSVRRVLTVQEKLHSDTLPPHAELYVNLLEEEDGVVRQDESDDTASTASLMSQRPTPAHSKLNTPQTSFSAADRTRPNVPLDLAKLLDPFEQLEREFGWESGAVIPIRPPSAFCSLADIQEDLMEKFVDEADEEKLEVQEEEEEEEDCEKVRDVEEFVDEFNETEFIKAFNAFDSVRDDKASVNKSGDIGEKSEEVIEEGGGHDDSGICDVLETITEKNRDGENPEDSSQDGTRTVRSSDVKKGGRQNLQNMQPGSYLTLDRRHPNKNRGGNAHCDYRRHHNQTDGGSMEGVVVSHQHTCSQDSSDSGSLPPTYSRLPPDGHEFPEDYVDPSFHGFHDFGKSGVCADQDFLSRKSSASSTASLDRHEFKMTIAGKKYATSEDRVSGVRAKIAMFSNGTSAKPGASKPVLGKFQSSEDVGKLSNGDNGSLTRAHTHGDVRFEGGLKKQGSQSSIKSLTSLNGSRSDHVGGQKGKIYSNLKPQNKSTSFRSMINVSSTTRESPTSPDDKSVSIVDLTKSTDNLIRSHEVDSVIREEPEKKSRVAAPSINNRSQSLMEITNNTLPKRPDVGSQGRSRSSNLIGQATIEEARKNSLTSLMAGRRSTTMSKLKGLVIPEAKESNTGENNMTQPSTGHKEKTSATNEKTLRTSQNKMGGGTLPNPPWKEKNSNDFPKYSPAFKRKQFSVYLTGNSSRPASIGGTSQASAGNQNQDGRSTSPKLPANVESKPMNGAHTADHVTESSDSSKKQVTEQLAYKPPIGKRNSDDGNHQTHRTEDSDNDSAVSSGRSSLSGRSATPPTSPNRGRKNSDEKNVLDKNQNSKKGTPENPRVLKKHSIEAINRRNVLMSCKKSSANTPAINDIQTAITGEELKKAELTDPPLETSSPRNSRTLGRPASRSSSFTIAERKKSFESSTKVSETSSRRGSNSSQDSLSRRSSRENFDLSRRSSREAQEDLSSRRTSKEDHVITPTRSYNMYPNSILDIEEKVAYMTDVVDRASPTTPTDRRSLSRTNSMASERSTYSSKSSRNSSIICEKTPFGRNNSILSKDSAISEDIGRESSVGRELTPEAEKDNLPHKKTSSTEDSSRWSELEKKYNKGISAGSLENKMSKFVLNEHSPPNTTKNERPKELVFSPKKISNGKSSPGSKNFKELAEKWQIRTLETPTSPQSVLPTVNTLPRKNSKEKIVESPIKTFEDAAWSPTSSMQTSYYTPTGETDWPGFHIDNGFSKADIPDRKFSVPAFSNEKSVKLRDKKDNVPSRPSSLIESSDQKDLKIFEIGNLGDNNRLMLNSNSTSQSSSQADLLDSNSITSDTPKSPLPSSSSREILDVFSKGNNRRAVSVNDIRRAFEKAELSLSNIGIGSSKRSDMSTPSSHNRMSSLDSTTSEESSIPTPHFYGSVSSLTSGHTGLKDHYGSITSLASSTSMISPQELQNLIDEANQSLEESGTPSHEIMVIVLHREFSGGSIGITLAGGADYESKEITVHKVIAGSLADRDGRIQKGDRVLSINGRSIKGVSHREALSILKAPRPEVVLVVSRSRSVTPAERAYGVGISVDDLSFNYINSSRPPKILESPLDHKSLMADLKFVDVPRGPPITVTLKKEGTGLGFSLEGGKDSPYGDRPMTIKKIFTGGAADKNGVLKVGDAIMSVNTADCTRMTRLEAWNYMKKLNDGMASVIVRQKLDPCHKQQPVPIVKAELVVDDPMEKSP